MSTPSTKSVDLTQKKENGKRVVDSSIKNQSKTDVLHLIIRDGVYGYIFWSIFQALGAMIWFYPLNELEISGYEAFAAVWFSPIICIIPKVHNFLQKKWVLIFLRLVTVGSVASFQAPTTLTRLIILAIGAGVSMLVLAATLWHQVKAVRYRTYWGLVLGLHSFLASRVWFVTFAPAWWDNYTNSFVIACGVISALGYISEEESPKESGKGSVSSDSTLRSVVCGIGFGSLLYLTHMCFGEASLVTRWTVKGYPNTGPLPLPWGSAVLLALLLGTLWRSEQTTIKKLAGATFCIYVMLYSDPWVGFIAGCSLGYLTMLMWPDIVDRATQCQPGLCLAVASLTYIFQVLFWVWTVAFNFVPYGEYTREHTDWVVGCVMAGILLPVVFTKIPAPSFTASYDDKPDKSVPSFREYARVIVFIFLIGQAGMLKRHMKYTPGITAKVNSKVFTAGIWTYHFGYDNRGWQSMERAATLLNDTGADVITLLESDASKPFLGNNDLATWLAEKLNMYVDFGPSTKDHTWGNLILSKYPIIKSQHHLLPSPHGELAPAITASINISGTLVEFVVTHMGNDRDRLDRKLQAQFLAKELRNATGPAVFLGYVTSEPKSENYLHLIREGQMKDIDPTDMSRWCEYIMYKKLIRRGYARISHGGLSDTEVQLGTFQIPDNPDNFQDNQQVTVKPSTKNIDEGVLFNKKFGFYHEGHGYFDHNGFHMNTPKYFYND
ncbi:unnamed protein product [Lymnaea stagnalis]|uniref:PGAP2-interacting protein n=1 Tax=Lymnaea stagnalis TaxID=6523 RepID=A0AAV2I3I7_LYMST